MTKQYIKLPRISNQKIRQKYYTSQSVSHPAKAQIPMMHWILKKFVKDGEIILDPMAGIFTTGIEGMRLFSNSLFIGVELEDKFVKMAQPNIKKVEKIAKKDMFLKIGKAVCVQGDARELEKILKEKVSKIVTSPPFQEADIQRPGSQKSRANYNYGSKLKHTPKNPNNIANLAERNYGSVNKIISSPPFGGKVQHKTNYLGKQKKESGFEYSDNPENIGNMPHGKIDKVITSPPYAQTISPKSGGDTAKEFDCGACRKLRGYSPNENNIGNKEYGEVDKVITSPPYEEGIGHGRGRNEELTRSKKIYLKGRDSYSKSKTNIGSLTGKTYLGDMLKVYRECLKILKSGGLMILITKDFIRNKKRVKLGEDTIKLCQAAGFTFKKIYYCKIEHPSFWRILYQQKHPEVEKIDSEDILIFEKKN